MPTIPSQLTGRQTRVAASYGRFRTVTAQNKQTIALLPDRVDNESTVLTVTAPTDATLYAFTITDSRPAISGGTGIVLTASATSTSTTPADLIALFVADLDADANTELLLESYADDATTITFVARPGVTLTYTETAALAKEYEEARLEAHEVLPADFRLPGFLDHRGPFRPMSEPRCHEHRGRGGAFRPPR